MCFVFAFFVSVPDLLSFILGQLIYTSSVYLEYPAILQITSPSDKSKLEPHIVPHIPFTFISTLPSNGPDPPTSRIPEIYIPLILIKV